MIQALLTVLLLFGCGRNQGKDDQGNDVLASWPDGTNTRYSIEVRIMRDGRAATGRQWDAEVVAIPDVRFIRTSESFVLGRAYWRYMALSNASNGEPLGEFNQGVPPDWRLCTNELWFAVDKYKGYPECMLLVTTNATQWTKWCNTNKVSTNLVEISQFQQQHRLVESIKSHVKSD